MFKNFEYFASISFTHSKRFDPNVFGMNLDGDIITAESRNPFKSKYCYGLAVNVKRKYFTIVRIVHYKNNMCYNDYIAERPANSNYKCKKKRRGNPIIPLLFLKTIDFSSDHIRMMKK